MNRIAVIMLIIAVQLVALAMGAPAFLVSWGGLAVVFFLDLLRLANAPGITFWIGHARADSALGAGLALIAGGGAWLAAWSVFAVAELLFALPGGMR